ncbi:MAG: ParA family protein [Gemmataceae bacterium]
MCACLTQPRSAVQTIAVYSNKGGAGKSAVTVLLAEALASKPFSKRVLVVDLDAQQSAATALIGDEVLHAALVAGRSVTALIQARQRGPLAIEATKNYLITRPAIAGRGNRNFLQTLHLLASDREAWHDLDEQLREKTRRDQNGSSQVKLLREALSPLHEDYDIALIDFPGHDSGPIVRSGLYAADRWLFPVTPDRMGARDLDGSLQVIRKAYSGASRHIKGLGTLLTMCQNRGGDEYKFARNMLQALAAKHRVPPLFAKEAELSFWTDVKNALDDTRKKVSTLEMKLGGKSTAPLFQAMQKLARETLKRLQMAIPAQESIEADELVNAVVTQHW